MQGHLCEVRMLHSRLCEMKLKRYVIPSAITNVRYASLDFSAVADESTCQFKGLKLESMDGCDVFAFVCSYVRMCACCKTKCVMAKMQIPYHTILPGKTSSYRC